MSERFYIAVQGSYLQRSINSSHFAQKGKVLILCPLGEMDLTLVLFEYWIRPIKKLHHTGYDPNKPKL